MSRKFRFEIFVSKRKNGLLILVKVMVLSLRSSAINIRNHYENLGIKVVVLSLMDAILLLILAVTADDAVMR